MKNVLADDKYFPMSIDEHPELQFSIDGFFYRFTLPVTAAFCAFGYAVYFGYFSVDHLTYIDWLLQYCTFCNARYEGLQQVDGVSGAVYIMLLPWGFAATVASSTVYICKYLKI